MVRAVSAFIDFFNSSGCEGITFGEMKHFLEEVLDSTLQELSNVKQLDQISSFDKLKGQARLRRHRCQGFILFRPYLTWIWPRLIGILGGLNTHCAISGQELSNSSRVLFTDENSEYLIGSICADPDREPTSNILGQKHRRQFQNEGKHFLIDSDQLNSDQTKSPNIDLIHKFIKSWLFMNQTSKWWRHDYSSIFTEIFKSAIQPVRSSSLPQSVLFSRMSDIKSNWLSRYLANPIVKEYQCQLGDQSLCYSETMTEIKEFWANRMENIECFDNIEASDWLPNRKVVHWCSCANDSTF